MKKRNIVFLLIVLGFLFSCSDDNDDKNDMNSENAIFETTFTISDSEGIERSVFSQGEAITFTINMTNLTNETQVMQFSSGQFYDIEVDNSEGSLIWQWSHDKVFTQNMPELIFDPDETKSYEEIWNQESNKGSQIDIGGYSVYAYSTGSYGSEAGPYYIDIE